MAAAANVAAGIATAGNASAGNAKAGNAVAGNAKAGNTAATTAAAGSKTGNAAGSGGARQMAAGRGVTGLGTAGHSTPGRSAPGQRTTAHEAAGYGTTGYGTVGHPASGNLEDTVTARWRRRVAGVRAEEKRHWRTKTAYYAAVNRLVTDGAPRLGWSQIAQAVEPRGSRSTFYEVTGAHAKHPLIGDLLADDGIDAMQLAMCYRRDKAVDQLIDETKVWTYWPYRECLSIRYRIEPNLDAHASAEMLVFTVAEWARRNARLASMLGCAPPVCAVEDLLVVRPGQLSALCAVNTLTRVVRDAIGGGGPGGYPVGGYRNW